MGHRESARAWAENERRASQEVTIPPVANPLRRLAAEADSQLFLETYLGDRFFDPWTDDRRRMLSEIRYRSEHGGDKAIAAPRGEGKTTLAECEVGVSSIVTGRLKFPLIVAATGPDATRILRNIKEMYEFPQPSGCDALAEDFPEVCAPIRDLDGAPQKCGKQRAFGERTRMTWSGEFVQFPRVTLQWCPKCYYPEPRIREGHLECPRCGETYRPWMSKASGSVLMARGLDAAIRGIRVGGQRPDFCIVDDGETRESAKSSKQIADRIRTIENDLGGLGGGRRRIGRLMLCTVINSMCVASQYTDKQQRPSWDGERLALVQRWPDRKDLWERYIEIRKEGQEQGDKQGRAAHAFYVENREAMDAGVIVSNAWRFSEAVAEDGSPLELSTIQHVHNEASDKGWDYVFNELQNDPQDEETTEEDKLSPFVVRGSVASHHGRCNGIPRGVVPAECETLTAFVDVQHSRLFFVVCAWLPGGRCHVVDYEDFDPSDRHKVIGPEKAITERLQRLRDRFANEPYHLPDGGERALDIVIVDSGDQQQAIVDAVLAIGRPWWCSKGEANYRHPERDPKTGRYPSGKHPSHNRDRWYKSDQSLVQRRWQQIHFDPDWWRERVHAAFRLPPLEDSQPRSGCVTLPGDRPEQHSLFAQQICDRQFFREWVDEKRGFRQGWTEGKNDHYLDCMIGNFVARSMQSGQVQRTPISLSELQRHKREQRR